MRTGMCVSEKRILQAFAHAGLAMLVVGFLVAIIGGKDLVSNPHVSIVGASMSAAVFAVWYIPNILRIFTAPRSR